MVYVTMGHGSVMSPPGRNLSILQSLIAFMHFRVDVCSSIQLVSLPPPHMLTHLNMGAALKLVRYPTGVILCGHMTIDVHMFVSVHKMCNTCNNVNLLVLC